MILKAPFARAFFEAALPSWLVLTLLMFIGRGNMGLLGLAAMLFPGVWGALRIQAPAGSWLHRMGYYLAFCLAQGMGIVAIVAAAALLLRFVGLQSSGSGGLETLLIMLLLPGAAFLPLRGAIALPGTLHAWGRRGIIARAAYLALFTAILAAGYWWASQPYVGHAAFSEPRILTDSPLTDSSSADGWRVSDPTVTLREENGALHLAYSVTPTWFYTVTWQVKPGDLPRTDGLAVQARSDAPTCLIVELEEAGGGNYRAWDDLPAGDWKTLVFSDWLPSLLARDTNDQLNWEQVVRVTFYVYLETVATGVWLDGIEAVTLDHMGEAPWLVATSEHFMVRYHPSDQGVVADVQRSAEDHFDRLTSIIGYHPKSRIPITIVSSHAELERRIGIVKPAWSIANALPDSLDLLTPRLYFALFNNHDYDDISRLVPHELTHMLIGQVVGYPGARNLPVWLNEGIATYLASQGIGKKALVDAARQGRVPSLQELEKPFSELERSEVAYSIAGSVGGYLIETYGAERISILLQALGGGADLDTALRQVIGIDRVTLERQWLKWLIESDG